MKFYEAAKNPNFQAIRKKIIMNRYSEAKSFEEALFIEMNKSNSQWALQSEIYYTSQLKRNFKSRAAFFIAAEYYIPKNEYQNYFRSKQSSLEPDNTVIIVDYEYIGIPITIEDIFILLHSQTLFPNSFTHKASITIQSEADEILLFFMGFSWKLNNLLHAQTPETWRSISQVLQLI